MAKRVSVVWTNPALESLLEIVHHIQLDNPPAARRFASSIKAKVARLQDFPESGRRIPEFPSSGVRAIIVKDPIALLSEAGTGLKSWPSGLTLASQVFPVTSEQ